MLPPETTIGHVHLKVTDLARAEHFYVDVLGFTVMDRWPGAVFMSAGGYHHHIAINTWESEGAPSPAPARAPGLYHVAILFPDRRSLGAAVRRVLAAGIPLAGASDHGVSEAVYLEDPDGNGIELYRDRPRQDWPRKADGSPRMYTRPLDLDALLAEAEPPAP
jgi:catechol 2,3-dioxygenase